MSNSPVQAWIICKYFFGISPPGGREATGALPGRIAPQEDEGEQRYLQEVRTTGLNDKNLRRPEATDGRRHRGTLR